MKLVAGALAVWLAACAAQIPAVIVAPSSAPASAPASLPTPGATVTLTREQFDRMAIAVANKNRDKNLAIAGCKEDLTVMGAQNDAANARVSVLEFRLKLAAILGSVGAAALTAIAIAVGLRGK